MQPDLGTSVPLASFAEILRGSINQESQAMNTVVLDILAVCNYKQLHPAFQVCLLSVHHTSAKTSRRSCNHHREVHRKVDTKDVCSFCSCANFLFHVYKQGLVYIFGRFASELICIGSASLKFSQEL